MVSLENMQHSFETLCQKSQIKQRFWDKGCAHISKIYNYFYKKIA